MLITNDNDYAFKQVLLEPAMNHDKLMVITGYSSPQMVYRHLHEKLELEPF